MLEYIQPEDLGDVERDALLASLSAASPWYREDPELLWGELQAGLLHAFRYKDAFVALQRLHSNGETRLSVRALHDPSGHFGTSIRGLTADFRRLAAEWECDKIETTCYSPHLAEVVKAMGARVECVTMVIDLETSNGQ